MYSTCLFCNSSLGRNEVIEHFPVGRRLAFDAAKGRLWVVCRKCERWNLSPLEERWEAIEDAERLFSTTRMRVSTDNIGMARLREGLELVRIGSALRPEMAAWRYGDQFGRRRVKHMAYSAAGMALFAGFVFAGPATGFIAGGGWGLWQLASTAHNWYDRKRVRAKLRLPGSEEVLAVRKRHLTHASIIRDTDDDWALRVSLRKPSSSEPVQIEARGDTAGAHPRVVIYKGREALQAAAKLLPAINEKGAKSAEVRSAVELFAESDEPGRLFRRYAETAPRLSGRRRLVDPAGGHLLTAFPKEVRLALEMAAHEEQERRAMEGELALLEAAWREAEEVAGIADDLFLPDDTAARLETLRKG